MSTTKDPRSGRGPFHGTVQIVQYNWPSYLLGALACVLGLALALWLPSPLFVRRFLGATAGLAGFWLAGSLLASYWVYDHSPLYHWDWIGPLYPAAPRCWANLHMGLDDTTLALLRLFPRTESTVLDLYDPVEMTEPSIRRARKLTPAPVPAAAADVAALPFRNEELDAVFLIFVAHEIRRPELRRRFFQELSRVLKPEGKILMVEHLRDVPNFIAFGPWFVHFQSRREWLRVARAAGLAVTREFRFTPFVGVFVLQISE